MGLKYHINVYILYLCTLKQYKTNNIWGCHGFDVVIGISGLRVRELFSVINGQTKLNDNSKIVDMNAYRMAKAA